MLAQGKRAAMLSHINFVAGCQYEWRVPLTMDMEHTLIVDGVVFRPHDNLCFVRTMGWNKCYWCDMEEQYMYEAIPIIEHWPLGAMDQGKGLCTRCMARALWQSQPTVPRRPNNMDRAAVYLQLAFGKTFNKDIRWRIATLLASHWKL